MDTESKSKVRIGIIATGGTLAMAPDEHGVLKPAKDLKFLLSKVNFSDLEDRMELPDELQIDLMNIDSSNMNPTHWEKIIHEIKNMQDKCDGILVLHGTDTMAYTASATALSLAYTQKIPVVFTGSQLPILDTGSDAITNIERALQVLETAAKDGVVETLIFFNDEAYRAAASSKVNESRFNAFDSPSGQVLYRVDAFGIKKTTQPQMASHREKGLAEYRSIVGVDLQPHFASHKITYISVYPGITQEIIEHNAKTPGCRVLILKSFGAGNLPSSDDEEFQESNLIPSIKKIHDELGIIVIITSPFRGGDTNMQVYESGVKVSKAGAIDAGRMTDEAAIAKAGLLLGQEHFSSEALAQNPVERREEFKKLFKLDFVGETGKTFDYVPPGM